ncbi:protein FAM36A [Trichinella spiralis]|uniref:protein FAM36A n=1 Tax=Trichinella spiralis TaxID=6334 RepID=UPI0001EFB555|nr:protein FAM36A [Trichinella spiralis]
MSTMDDQPKETFFDMAKKRMLNPLEIPCFSRSQLYGILAGVFFSLGIFGWTGQMQRSFRAGGFVYFVTSLTMFAICRRGKHEIQIAVEEAKQAMQAKQHANSE